MVIAIASENEQVIAFGGTPEFTVFKVEGTHQREREIIPMPFRSGTCIAAGKT